MKQIFTSVLFIGITLMMISSNAFAQFGELRGTVTDSLNKEPLPFANVVIRMDSVKMGVSTDIEGNYRIKPVKPGIYEIRVSYVGYKDVIIKGYEIKANLISFQNIKLAVSMLKTKEVVIMTYAKPLVEADEGSGSSRISSREFKKAPTRSVGVMDDSKPVYVGITAGMLDKTRDTGPGLIKTDGNPVPVTDELNLSDILTAGEINDFSKWDLWKDLNDGDLKSMQDYWKFKPLERYTVQVITENGRPLPDCEVAILNKNNKVEWTARTDNTGKAELWVNIFTEEKFRKGYSAKINYKGINYSIDKLLKFNDGINIVTLPVKCNVPDKADIMFVVDATGSMSDEIDYLKSELNNIILKVKKQNNNLEINLGSVFYRDNGDIYVTRKSDFSTNISTTTDFIRNQSAGGGGDEPEAVHTALNVAINGMKWSDSAVARLLFLVLDAPPHYSQGIIDSLQMLIAEAALKGIKIIPITGSGINKSAEYLMRAFALATNGTYVFLTDHSKVGNSHIKPTTDEYDVHLLKDVLLRILHQNLFTPSCSDQPDMAGKQRKDTMYVVNPKIIAHEITDTSLVGKYFDQNIPIDTNRISFVDSSKYSEKTRNTAIINDPQIPGFTNFRYYPNPTTGKLNIEFKGKVNEIYLADISGKLLEKYLINGKEKLEINIGKYPVGIYFLQYFYSNKWLAGKVILSR